MRGIFGALVASLFATACCLPPLLFLVFGVSFGFLSFLEVLTPFRIPLSLFSVLILYVSWRAYTQKCFTCKVQKRTRNVWLYGIFLTLIVVILLYPEWVMLFLECEE